MTDTNGNVWITLELKQAGLWYASPFPREGIGQGSLNESSALSYSYGTDGLLKMTVSLSVKKKQRQIKNKGKRKINK